MTTPKTHAAEVGTASMTTSKPYALKGMERKEKMERKDVRTCHASTNNMLAQGMFEL